MQNQNSRTQQWVDFRYSEPGVFRVHNRLLRIAPYKKSSTNPKNPPDFGLYDITDRKAEWLTALWINGDHLGGDIQVDGERYRFKIMPTEGGIRAYGLDRAIAQRYKNTLVDFSSLLGGLQPLNEGTESVQDEGAEGAERASE